MTDICGLCRHTGVAHDHLVHQLEIDAGPCHDLLENDGTERVRGQFLQGRSGLGVGCSDPVYDDDVVHEHLVRET
jgi:hypothetical protein